MPNTYSFYEQAKLLTTTQNFHLLYKQYMLLQVL